MPCKDLALFAASLGVGAPPSLSLCHPVVPSLSHHLWQGIGWTPLHYAVEFRRFQVRNIVALLVRALAPSTQCCRACVQIIKFLCECCGANVFIRDWVRGEVVGEVTDLPDAALV